MPALLEDALFTIHLSHLLERCVVVLRPQGVLVDLFGARLTQHFGCFVVVAAKSLNKGSVALPVFAINIDALQDQIVDDQPLALCSSIVNRAAHSVVIASVKVVNRAIMSETVQIAMSRGVKNLCDDLRAGNFRCAAAWLWNNVAGEAGIGAC